MARVVEDGEWKPREWRMPVIPADVRMVQRKTPLVSGWRPWRFVREGDTRFWVYLNADGIRADTHMTEKDMIAGYGPLIEVREEEQHG